MTYHSLETAPPEDPWALAPSYVRQAALQKARSWRALLLYRRRGWNESAVRSAFDRDARALREAIDRWEFEESNPYLF